MQYSSSRLPHSASSWAYVLIARRLMPQVFGNSPDETAYFRIALNREAVPDALLAIQPAMLAYQLEQPVQVGLSCMQQAALCPTPDR